MGTEVLCHSGQERWLMHWVVSPPMGWVGGSRSSTVPLAVGREPSEEVGRGSLGWSQHLSWSQALFSSLLVAPGSRELQRGFCCAYPLETLETHNLQVPPQRGAGR